MACGDYILNPVKLIGQLAFLFDNANELDTMSKGIKAVAGWRRELCCSVDVAKEDLYDRSGKRPASQALAGIRTWRGAWLTDEKMK